MSFYSRLKRASIATSLLLCAPFESIAEPSGKGLTPDDLGPSVPIWLSLSVAIIIIAFSVAGPDQEKEEELSKKKKVILIIKRFFRGFNKIVVFLLSQVIKVISGIADLFKPSENTHYRDQIETICDGILLSKRYPNMKNAYEIYKYDARPEITRAFKKLNVSEEEWKEVSSRLNNIGNIVRITTNLRQAEDILSHEEIKAKRVALLENLQGRCASPLAYPEFQSALQLFNIPEEEWIEDGHRVIFNHHLLNNPEIENFSLKTGIDISKIINSLG